MSRTDVHAEIADFATTMIEHSGGIVDWMPDHSAAVVMAPEELAQSLGQLSETFRFTRETADNSLTLSLAGEFLDLASRTLRVFVPAVGSFEYPEVSLRKSEFASVIEKTFGWQNARCRIGGTHPMKIPYQLWWFHVTFQSEETWEAIVPLSLNSVTGCVVPLDNILDLESLQPAKQVEVNIDVEATLPCVGRRVQAIAMDRGSEFLQRIDSRRQRDQKRLRDYYKAMINESSKPNRRTKVALSLEEAQARKNVIQSELMRKLEELDARYQVAATVRPIALAEVRLPVMGVDCEIQRKAATRNYRVYYNALLHTMEPLLCCRCSQPSFNFWFENETVNALCARCK